jgi:hypothetical protein
LFKGNPSGFASQLLFFAERPRKINNGMADAVVENKIYFSCMFSESTH